MTVNTLTLPDDILCGMPVARLGRWQPLRAGIVGVFRYDVQEFVFYNGRLLFRGANGNGKSMALEVLLPYLLDADMSPERLSTFGGRNRGMYTWLLGHDKTAARESARGYVWIEFGRVGTDGLPEYFTAGAGLEATRSGGNVNAWYFTTTARFGVQLPGFRRGTEPVNKDGLGTLLATAAQAGLPGAIRTPQKHREECNRVLYSLDAHKYEALRKALTQLRRPKLSDGLSESGLAAILRDSLAPLDAAVIESIADGYDRLDRHRDNLRELNEIRSALRTLERTYRDYARSALRTRAHDLLALHAAVARADETAGKIGKRVKVIEGQIANNGVDSERTRSKIAEQNGTLDGLRASEDYREGKDLAPLLEEVKAKELYAANLSAAADTARGQAGTATTSAGTLKTAADRARGNANTAQDAARKSAEDAILVREAHRNLVDTCTTGAELSAQELQEAQQQVDDTAEDSRKQLSTLTRLVEAGRSAHDLATAATTRREEAEEAAELAEQGLRDAEGHLQELLVHLAELTNTWAGRSGQLLQGEPAPPFTPENVETRAKAWLQRAERARLAQLFAIEQGIRGVRQARSTLADRATVGTHAAGQARAALATAADAQRDAEQAKDDWTDKLRGWIDDADQLLGASTVELPELTANPSQWAQWRDQARQAHAKASARALEELNTERAEIGTVTGPLEAEIESLNVELQELTIGGRTTLPEPYTRRTARAGRPGAPFFQLTDFRDPDLDADRAAQLEAALIGAEIADAWVSPDGRLLTDSGTPLCDIQLVPAGPASATPLSAALRCDPAGAQAAGVDIDVVNAILDRITLCEDNQDDARVGLAVAWNGTWRTAISHGAHTQDSAYLIGEASRERARRRRMDTIGRLLTALDNQLRPLREQLEALQTRQTGLEQAQQAADGQADRLPDPGPMTDAEANAGLTRGLADAACRLLEPAIQAITTAIADATSRARTALGAARSGTTAAPLPASDPAPPQADMAPQELLAAFQTAENAAAATLTDTDAAIAEAEVALARHRSQLAAEATAPTSAELPAARAELASTRAAATAAGQTLGTATTDETKALAHSRDQRTIATAALTAAGLADHGEDLEDIRRRVAAWYTTARTYLQELERAEAAERQAAEAAATAKDFAQDAQTAADNAAGPNDEAARARAKYTALHQRLGTAFGEIEALIEQQAAEITELEKHLSELGAALPPLHGELGATNAKADEARRTLQELRGKLPAKMGALIAACAVQLPAAAEWDIPAPQDADPEAALATARFIIDLAEDGRPAPELEDAVNTTTRARHDAEASLGNRLTLTERWTDGVFVVEAKRGGNLQTLRDTANEIKQELIIAEGLIEREEGELLEQFLDTDVRRQVTARIDAAKAQNKAMNVLLDNHGTSSGVKILLKWVPDKAAEGFTPEVVELLDAEFDASPTSKARLAAFFKGRIATLRAQNDGRTWRDLLSQMLDYRTWYRYEIKYKYEAGEWTNLSSKEHGALSGGEKAVALHLPLFAAAAIHTTAAAVRDTTDPTRPGCPRLILLDEVFAGISEDNRGGLFDLVRKLDMDLIATSPDETGMYSELDGIAVYHLIKHQSLPGTLAVRSVWDGFDSHDLLESDMAREGF
ncbi:SbcC/MukB-like Walker B domain-containing protein [Catenulispora pinisilvae]|uniref:SbcC/MukB-like Walker B domain-containing protein n=1 Tax=Catenulispora pinisilvae TaxID=2705253 RepID=UPI0018927763|nr:SbcC/MukB-like Walker B domain-containing protein [Catenulispora pinisilvae]